MNEIILLNFKKSGKKSPVTQVILKDYVSVDTFLQKMNEMLFQVSFQSINQTTFEEALSSLGKVSALTSGNEEDVMLLVDFDDKELVFLKEIAENATVEDKELERVDDSVALSKYQLYKDAVEEFRFCSSLNEGQKERLSKIFFEVFTDCEILMNLFIEEYPMITRREVFDVIYKGVSEHEAWIYDAFNFIDQYENTIQSSFEPVDGKYYIYVPMDKIMEYQAEKKGARYDKDKMLFYYTNPEDAYKFGEWLPIKINQGDEDETDNPNISENEDDTLLSDDETELNS